MTTLETTLETLGTADLVKIYNAASNSPVNRFSDRPTALKRTAAAIERIGVAELAGICRSLSIEPPESWYPGKWSAEVPAIAGTAPLGLKAALEASLAEPVGPFKVRYSSVDGFGKSMTFARLKSARNWAAKWVGEHPEIGSSYAVSGDGIGKVTVSGCSLADLFPAPATDPVLEANIAAVVADSMGPRPRKARLDAAIAARVAAAAPLATSKPAGKSAPVEGGFRRDPHVPAAPASDKAPNAKQAAMIALLTRPQGAVRKELLAAMNAVAGASPSACLKLADLFGYDFHYTAKTDTTPVSYRLTAKRS